MPMKLHTCWPLLVLLALPARAAPPTYPCYQPDKAPVIDGNVAGDAAWSNLPAVTGFSKLGAGYTLDKQTVVRACWDGQALYVAMVCEEPDVAQLKQTVRDGGPFWEDDGVEIFLQPATHKQALQLGVTAFGAKGGFEGFADFTKCQAAATRGGDSYSLEMRIPFEILRATPKVGDKWRGNFCRNIWVTTSGGDKFTCWAPLKTRFLEPENYAVLAFHGPAPQAAEAGEVSEKLNGAYRKHLIGGLRAAVGQGKEYTKVLDDASRDGQFGEKASDLLARWREVESLSRQASKAPILELRRTIADIDSLVRASYGVKYAYLISELFGDE